MGNENIFAEEWRDCLEAHYSHTVRERDEITLRTLVKVMHEVGFNEDELRALYLKATMHVDDVGPDFLPDLARAIEPEPPPAPVIQPVAVVEPEPEPYVPPTNEQAQAEEVEADENRYIPPPPQQLSLF